MECAYYFASLNGIAFNGKPQASSAYFACACGSPLNKNVQCTTKSTTRHATGIGFVSPSGLKTRIQKAIANQCGHAEQFMANSLVKAMSLRELCPEICLQAWNCGGWAVKLPTEESKMHSSKISLKVRSCSPGARCCEHSMNKSGSKG